MKRDFNNDNNNNNIHIHSFIHSIYGERDECGKSTFQIVQPCHKFFSIKANNETGRRHKTLEKTNIAGELRIDSLAYKTATIRKH